MSTKVLEEPSKPSPRATKGSDWQDSIYQPPTGKLVKQSKNDVAGANVISDESIRVPGLLKLGHRIKVPSIIYTQTQMGCIKRNPCFVFQYLFLWPWNWLLNKEHFCKGGKLPTWGDLEAVFTQSWN